MGEVNNQKFRLKIIIVGFLLSFTLIIATTPIHEAGHWFMSYADPYVEPVEFHIFDDFASQNEKNVLFSAFGSVVIKERYPGAFDDRPLWIDPLQELICVFLQIIITVLIVSKSIRFLLEKNLEKISASALDI